MDVDSPYKETKINMLRLNIDRTNRSYRQHVVGKSLNVEQKGTPIPPYKLNWKRSPQKVSC